LIDNNDREKGGIMELSEIMKKLKLENINKEPIIDGLTLEHGYTCDLLSQVLGKAKSSSIWITIQSHLNIIGVAVMVGISAIIVCEGHDVPEEVITKADEEGIVLFKSPENAYRLSGKLYKCGIR